MSDKAYDRAYFDRWYRHPRSRVWTGADVERKVRLAVAAAEVVLGRQVRSALDVGCGEASWQLVLRRIRPRATYTGVDPSPYVIARFGRRRHIRLGSFGRLEDVRLRSAYDLVVACDLLHYLPTDEVARGLAHLAPRTRGVAYLETYTALDAVTGDRRGFHRRAPSTYRRLMRQAGFVPCGMHLYVPERTAHDLVALERWSSP
jgi:SAM-dependent methyltransferase